MSDQVKKQQDLNNKLVALKGKYRRVKGMILAHGLSVRRILSSTLTISGHNNVKKSRKDDSESSNWLADFGV